MNIGDILMTSRLAKFLAAHARIGVAVILALCTISGGLLAQGYLVAGLILIVGLLAILVKVCIDIKQDSNSQHHLSWKSFALADAGWLTEDNRRILETLSRGALLLLEFDRTASGCWGKSYLYRRFKSSKSDEPSLPLAGGSLTGIPVVLLAVGSATKLPISVLHAWAFENLSATLASILTDTGEYRMGHRIGTTGQVEVPEPLRHAAGGFFAALLQGSLDSRNLTTLETLCTSVPSSLSWDQAIVARALLQALRESFFPRKLRRRARRKYIKILCGLVEMARRQPISALYWADPIRHTTSATIQWATVWALLPSIMDPMTPPSLKTSLRQAVRSLLLAQEDAVPEHGSGLPSRVDESGKGQGLHVFGTAIAALCWNFLAVNPHIPSDEVDLNRKYARRATDRLISAWPRLLEQPSRFDARDPISLEGWFAWAGLLLAVASTGTILPEGDAHRIFHTASKMKEVSVGSADEASLVGQYLDCCKKEGLFDERTDNIVARSAARIALLYREVTATEGDRAA